MTAFEKISKKAHREAISRNYEKGTGWYDSFCNGYCVALTTDPRLEVLDELEDFAGEYFNYDEALRQISVDRIHPKDLITFIDELRNKIKQEAEE
jgi:hypothetical protein